MHGRQVFMIRYSLLFRVSFTIKLAVPGARGWAAELTPETSQSGAQVFAAKLKY